MELGVIRNLPDDRIEALLEESVIARLACAAPAFGERPYLVPLPCFYDGQGLVALSGPGTKIRVMRANPLVTIEVDRGTAPDRWESVVAEGEYQELMDPDQRAAALGTIAAMSGDTPQLDEHTIVFRIRLTAKSGRYELPE
jgi:nitroimidazol reductase NimA-like FMN-containing flavoprotein (pyridoxamine 5'-phosphate oxidase superfamily)